MQYFGFSVFNVDIMQFINFYINVALEGITLMKGEENEHYIHTETGCR